MVTSATADLDIHTEVRGYDTLFKVKVDPFVRLGIAIYFYSPLWLF